jgi:predicted amidohydrolase
MAEVIKGIFPGSEGLDGALPGVSSVAALNLSPEPGDPEGNLLLAEREIRAALAIEPSLRYVVLPELFTCAYAALETVYLYAEDAESGESARFFTALARELGIYIAYGFPEGIAGSPAGVFDSANLVGPEGVISTYRKRNLVGTTPELFVFTAGTESRIVDAGGLRVALAVCWDLGFPEMVREPALGGADLVLVPAAWREPWGLQYDLSCAARALDNGVFVASANQSGAYPEAGFATHGHLYGPDGLRVSSSFGATSIGTVDLSASLRWRTAYGNTLIERAGDERLEIVS